MRLLSVLGTRPEAIKMAPVLLALRDQPAVESLLCVTAQHRELLDRALELFGLTPDFDLDLMAPSQGLNPLAARAVATLDKIMAESRPDRVIVQGDTTTALAAALAAFHRGIPVAHVEAGLRTYAPRSPWPEELNRRAIALAADLHFAPTAAARDNLCAERLHGQVFVTGNTGIDALRRIAARLEAEPALRRHADRRLPRLDPGRRLVLVTAHRRESLGARIGAIWSAVAALAARPDVEIVYPLHPNPAIAGPARSALAGAFNLHLLPPLDPAAFVRLMQRSTFILTDSGGVQEEAVALGKPVLVARDSTERCEAVGAGAARLAGTDAGRLLRQMKALLDDSRRLSRFTCRPDLYGDGEASRRIVAALLSRPFEEFAVARRAPPGRAAAPRRVTSAA